MKAAILHKNGDPTSSDVLSVIETNIPSPQEGEILLKVKAASINPIDWKLMRGDFPGKKEGPVGFDVSGIVEKIGPDTTTDLNVGDEVFADSAKTGGSFAEYCVVQEIALAKKPENITFKEAASLPLAGLTAIQGLLNIGKFKKGDKVLIYGGSGGVGSLAIQAAKSMGASEVYSTGSSVEMIKGFGADVVINYKEKSLMDSLKGQNFDIVFDTIGGYEHYEVALASMKPTATYLTIVGDGGGMLNVIVKMMCRKLWAKVFGGPKYELFLTDTTAPLVQESMQKLSELVQSGKVKAVVNDSEYSLTTEGVHDLVKASMSHRTKGKLILKVA